MSILNLLSDWTCYSVAPIALLTEEAFGAINAEQLVVVFLCANGIATACEPIILSRLGLRRTVLFGALLLMIGSIVKSGGMPPIIQADLKKGRGEWRVYLGFFLVGLSQPLYQCTPALLSASWFPEAERTLATSVALNANQLGIGFAFIFGTLLVKNSDDIPKYFGLLSMISTLAFLGTLIQFDDAPPTPPSDTARVMRGTLEVDIPSVEAIFKTVGWIGSTPPVDVSKQARTRRSTHREKRASHGSKEAGHGTGKEPKSDENEARRSHKKSTQRGSRSSPENRTRREGASSARRRVVKKSSGEHHADVGFHGLAPSPSPARWGPVAEDQDEPSLGATGTFEETASDVRSAVPDVDEGNIQPENAFHYFPPAPYMMMPPYPGQPGPYNPYMAYPQQQQPYQVPYWDPQYASQLAYFQQQGQMSYPPPGYQVPVDPYYSYYNSYQHGYEQYPSPSQYATPYHQPVPNTLLPPTEAVDEGAEPVILILPHHLDINIRDDQIWLSTRACLARPGFIHSLVSFTVSGIVINTLSTFMDYLVRLNGAGREYTGIVGGTFQFVIMISSLLIGRVCDDTRAYYSITIGMLVLGAFGLAECGVSLDANRGVSLRWSLICVALLVGPLQPVSTELGVDVVYPLSENTVLVIQQLFSNVLSAAFIPCFKAMKDFGAVSTEGGTGERPEYTFSFYLLIVLHAAATVFFATFNGRYLRYEHELEKKAQEEYKKNLNATRAFHRIAPESGEQVPLMSAIA
jgi:MFS family permease